MTRFKNDLARREREAQAALVEAESKAKAARDALSRAEAQHRAAQCAAQAVRNERDNEIRAAAHKREQAVRDENRRQQQAARLRPIDLRIDALSAEADDHRSNGNLAGYAALQDQLARLRQRRAALANP